MIINRNITIDGLMVNEERLTKLSLVIISLGYEGYTDSIIL